MGTNFIFRCACFSLPLSIWLVHNQFNFVVNHPVHENAATRAPRTQPFQPLHKLRHFHSRRFLSTSIHTFYSIWSPKVGIRLLNYSSTSILSKTELMNWSFAAFLFSPWTPSWFRVCKNSSTHHLQPQFWFLHSLRSCHRIEVMLYYLASYPRDVQTVLTGGNLA